MCRKTKNAPISRESEQKYSFFRVFFGVRLCRYAHGQQTGTDMRCLHPLVMAFGATTGVTSAAKYAIMYTDGVVKQNEYKNAYLGAA